MKVGFVQFCPVRYDVACNIAMLEALIAGVKADLLVLPELANSGYMYATSAALVPYAEPGDGTGPFLAALRRMAAEIGGMIVAGFAEQAAAGLYNSAAAVSAAFVAVIRPSTCAWATERRPSASSRSTCMSSATRAPFIVAPASRTGPSR